MSVLHMNCHLFYRYPGDSVPCYNSDCYLAVCDRTKILHAEVNTSGSRVLLSFPSQVHVDNCTCKSQLQVWKNKIVASNVNRTTFRQSMIYRIFSNFQESVFYFYPLPVLNLRKGFDIVEGDEGDITSTSGSQRKPVYLATSTLMERGNTLIHNGPVFQSLSG